MRLVCTWCGKDGPTVSSVSSKYEFGVYECPDCRVVQGEDLPDDIDENPEEKL